MAAKPKHRTLEVAQKELRRLCGLTEPYFKPNSLAPLGNETLVKIAEKEHDEIKAWEERCMMIFRSAQNLRRNIKDDYFKRRDKKQRATIACTACLTPDDFIVFRGNVRRYFSAAQRLRKNADKEARKIWQRVARCSSK